MSTGTLQRRRARPLLGTLVEVGTDAGDAAIDAAFDAIAAVQRALSRFDALSEIARFNRMRAGARQCVGEHVCAVLQAAQRLATLSDGGFDIALGSGRWALHGAQLHKLDAGTQLDLGGIAKGYAVDLATAALQAAGCSAGWVNAGGDLRCFGAATLALQLRDENAGGVRVFGQLQDGAFASSHFAPGSRCQLARRTRWANGAQATEGAGATPGAQRVQRAQGAQGVQRAEGTDGTDSAYLTHHVSVLAPSCLWADALTKIVALQGVDAPALQALGARAWVH